MDDGVGRLSLTAFSFGCSRQVSFGVDVRVLCVIGSLRLWALELFDEVGLFSGGMLGDGWSVDASFDFLIWQRRAGSVIFPSLGSSNRLRLVITFMRVYAVIEPLFLLICI